MLLNNNVNSTHVPNNSNNNNNIQFIPFNPEIFLQEIKQPKKKKEIPLETKLICVKLTQFEDKLYMLWENKKYENCCYISLQFGNGYLYSNKFENKQIRLFTCNNFFYAFYDTQNHVNIYTLFNNIVNKY
jgi:hypothetical protein